MDINEIVNLLEDIAPTVDGWHKIGKILRKQELETEHPLLKYVFAFEYMYVEETNGDYFERYGPFAPWIEMQGRVFPPPLEALEDEILAEWAQILEQVTHPVLCSRLADLLWVRKWGKRPDLYARQAIDAYLEISKGEWEELERTHCLMRAIDLSKEIRDTERKTKAITSSIEACYQALRKDDPKPGVSLRLLESLMKIPKAEIPTEVDALLELALEVHENDTWIVENIIDLMTKRATPERQKELRLNQINRWVEEANKSEKGILLLHHLQHALELARNFGFQDVADEMRRRIQSIPEEDFGFKTISAKVEVPSEKVDEYLNWFVDKRGWRESFTSFGDYGPPSGDYKKNIEEVEEQSQKSPIQFLVSRVVYDENNVPIRYGRNINENKEIVLVNNETMGIRIFGNMAPDILKRIKQQHGLPAQDELIEFFTTSLIPDDISKVIAQAFHWYFQGEFDIAAHILTPRIETIFRILVRELGLPIIREPVGSTPGSVVQLGNLLLMLQDRIDESWRRYFYNLLANPIGVNLRNRICHGLIPKVGQEDAALLLHAICYLRLLQKSVPDESI